MNVYNFNEIHQYVSHVLDRSDSIFLEGLRKDNIISTKLDINAYADIVSDYDRRIEDILVDELSKNTLRLDLLPKRQQKEIKKSGIGLLTQ